jgi:CheY-like chemotaxis protein
MDIRMPEMDGLEATRLIRKFNPLIPVFAQTAYSLPGDIETAINAGCTGFITKPINRKIVLSLLNNYLNAT